MTIQTLFDAYIASDPLQSITPPATEADIRQAEANIGAPLPPLLREVYLLFNGDWMWDLRFNQLDLNEHGFGLVNASEKYIEWGWTIPQEIRLFAHDGGSNAYGIYLPACGNRIFNHPIIEVGTITTEDGCMGVAGTNLISFLRGWSAYHLMEAEIDALNVVEDSGDPSALNQIQTALSMLQVPQHLLREPFYEVYEERFGSDPMSDWSVDHHFSQLRKWADPSLPDPYGDSYNQGYTIADLKKLFGET